MAVTSPKRVGRLLLILVILAIVFLPLAHRMFSRPTYIRAAVKYLRPGMGEAEVRALLKPIRRDFKLTSWNGRPFYSFRGIDEWIAVVMDGQGEDARVAEVKHHPDDGPWWERTRRNWEWWLR